MNNLSFIKAENQSLI